MPAGATVAEKLPLVSDLYLVNVGADQTISQLLSTLGDSPFVRLAQPDFEVSVGQVPNDPSFNLQWGEFNGSDPAADIDAAAAWDLTTGTGRIIVAVIDTGVDYNHPDLAANIWTNAGEIAGNGVDDDRNGFIDDLHGFDFYNYDGDPMDDHSHGTHVAGIIGAVGNNGIGVAGVNWNVQIMPLKFMGSTGSGPTSAAIQALNYAVNMGAKISNNSWGGGGYNQALYDAINNARSRGHIYVAAAGNAGSNNDVTPFYPSSYNLSNVVAVAATTSSDSLAGYSNYGAVNVDIGAPGDSIFSTMPGGGYGYKSGTSMAAPMVAGALSLVWDYHPTWTYSQVINAVLNSVDVLPSLTGKVVTGGRLNLARALGGASTPPPSQPTISINNVSQAEGESGTSPYTFTVTLSQVSLQTVTVNWATTNSSAEAGTDYLSNNGMLTFNPGETSKTFSVFVNGDTTYEPNETFSIVLSNATNSVIASGGGVGTITNDDAAPPPPPVEPSILIDSFARSEGDSGSSSFTFTVTLSHASAQTVSVNWTTVDGTATAGSDYVAGNGTLTFNPGETSKTITVFVNGDTAYESSETFSVQLSNVTNALLSGGSGVATINNDDAAPIPSVSIDDEAMAEGNTGYTQFTFTISLSAPATAASSVKWKTVAGTALASSDFTSATGTVSFAAGESTKTVKIKVKGDRVLEANETFTVVLSTPTNLNLGRAEGVGTIFNDDGNSGGSINSIRSNFAAMARAIGEFNLDWLSPAWNWRR